jgi:hypothetical protein
VIHTNLLTNGTYTQIFTANSKDNVITDNGDGTITIVVNSAGGWRAYDQFGKLVLRDPGNFRFSFDVDYGDTPGDPSDDVEVDDSFQVVRGSTGLNETEGRDFCADVLEFTS